MLPVKIMYWQMRCRVLLHGEWWSFFFGLTIHHLGVGVLCVCVTPPRVLNNSCD